MTFDVMDYKKFELRGCWEVDGGVCAYVDFEHGEALFGKAPEFFTVYGLHIACDSWEALVDCDGFTDAINVRKMAIELRAAKQEVEVAKSAPDALAIWEHALTDEVFRDWLQAGEGAAQGRSNALLIAPLLGNAYDSVGFDDSFDWEFVPRFVSTLMITLALHTAPAEFDQTDANIIAAHFMKQQ